MTRPVKTRPAKTRPETTTTDDPERAERARRIAAGAELAARVARDLADLVRDHADTIAGWGVWDLRRR